MRLWGRTSAGPAVTNRLVRGRLGTVVQYGSFGGPFRSVGLQPSPAGLSSFVLDWADNRGSQAPVGRIAIRHGQLDQMLRMTLKSIDDITTEEAWSRTGRMTSGLLCQCVRKAAKAAIGEGDAFMQIDALLIEAAGATEEINKIMHALWTFGEDGEHQNRPRGGPRQPAPTAFQLDVIANRLNAVAERLNHARRHGLLKEALEQRRSPKK
jgi:hypothetical protein